MTTIALSRHVYLQTALFGEFASAGFTLVREAKCCYIFLHGGVHTPGPVNVHGLALSDGNYHGCVLQGPFGQHLQASYVYSKQPIVRLTQEWLRELSFSRLECGVHDKLHSSSADRWDILLPLA